MHQPPISLVDSQSKITSLWTPEHIMTANDTHSFKLATIKGDFIWHCHPNSDEVFYCVSGGPLVLDIATDATTKHERDGFQSIQLQPGDLFNVPQGFRHRPKAEKETGILMIEKVGTINTGDEAESDIGKELTKVVDEA